MIEHPTASARPPRLARILRDWPSMLWLLTALVMTGIHRGVPQSGWLMVHLVLLGALTHAMLVWSWHFASTLSGLPRREDGGTHTVRLAVLPAGVLLVLVGLPLGMPWLVTVGALVAGSVVAWHGVAVVGLLRRALPRRFQITLRYYVVAAANFAVAAAAGATAAWPHSDEWHGRWLTAHSLLMLLGWVAPTVLGTLITFAPTLLRTRIDPAAERRARQALPWFAATPYLVAGAALADVVPAVIAGLAAWAVAAGWYGLALVAPFRAAPPRHFAAASVACALPWFPVALVMACAQIMAPTPVSFEGGYGRVAVVAAVGFALQILLGALSHLLPAMVGGGARAVRAGQTRFDRWAAARLVVVNLGLVVGLLPIPSWSRVAVSAVVVLASAAWAGLAGVAVRAMVAQKRAGLAEPGTDLGPEDRALGWRGALTGALVVAVAVAAGIGVDPRLATSGPRVEGDAPLQHVAVTIHGMHFSPSRIEVPRGTRVVLDVTNHDAATSHDLWFPQASLGRLAPGASGSLDLGVMTASSQGWCTVAGHKQAGMTLDVVVTGSTAMAGPAGGVPSVVRPDPTPGPGFAAVDPRLPALEETRHHEITLEIVEVEREIAPGIRQKAWTFNGTVPGPTLHGRVGDTFAVHVVNHGTMTHSVDFHAGIVAPDGVMRPIPPGESLDYQFTAVRSGIWLYHCATMPMSAHIAAGMFGAVVIEPDGLAPVDASYVLVQSEGYVDGDGRLAREVSADKISARRPDVVAFNGYANQYAFAPLKVAKGAKIRLWVLAAGPNDATSFHVVGAQFSSVWAEGAYLLDERRDAPGGSQALGLQPAQGGFVELTLPEAGHYTFVDHAMVDAELGSKGVIEVS